MRGPVRFASQQQSIYVSDIPVGNASAVIDGVMNKGES
jgi:hypothetical protein